MTDASKPRQNSMALQHQVILSHPINKENQAACAILDGGVNYLVEGRSEGLEGPKQMTQ